MLVGTYRAYRQKIEFMAGAKYTQGEVTDLVSVYGRGSGGQQYGRSLYMLVRYWVGGQEYRDRGQVSEGGLLLSRDIIGQKIGIYYDPINPQITLFDTFMEKWFGTLVGLGMGLLFVLFSSTMLVAIFWGQDKRRKGQK